MLANNDVSDEQIKRDLFYTFSALKKNNSLDENSDVIKFGDSHSYQLSRYTQSALASGENLDGLVEIGSYCIRLVIEHLLDKSVDIKPFYKDAFETWKKRLSLSKKEREELSEKRKLGVWKSAFIFDDDIKLVTRTRWIDDSFDPFKIKIIVYADKSPIYDCEPSIELDGMGALIIKSKKVSLDVSPLKKISYKIFHDEEVLYDSHEELYREIIFFDGETGTEIYPTKDFEGGAIVVTNNSAEPYAHIKFKQDNFYVSEFVIDTKKDYIFDGKHYGFKTIRKPELEGSKINWISVKSKVNNHEIAVYKEINSAVFEASFKIDDINIVFDGDIVTKEVCELFLLSSSSNGVNQYRAIIKDRNIGYHSVKFTSLKNKDIKNAFFEYIFDPKANQNSTSDFAYEISFLGVFKKDFINCEQEYINDSKLIKGLGPCEILYCLNTILISFDNEKWYLPNERIDSSTLNRVNQNLYIKTAGLNRIEVKTDTLRLEEPKFALEDLRGWKYRTPCGFIYSYEHNDARYCKITITNDVTTEEFVIDYVTYIDEKKSKFEFDNASKRLYITFEFSKNKNLKMELLSGGNVVVSRNIVNGEKVMTPALKGFKQYTVRLSESKGLLGKYKVCYEKVFYYCNKEDLIGRVFKIIKADVYGEEKNYIRSILGDEVTIKFLNKIPGDNDSYNGSILQLKENEYSYRKYNAMNSIGNIQIKVEDEFEGNEMWVYIYDKDEEMLCFDKKKSCIHGSTTDEASKKMDGIDRFLITFDR